MKRFIYPWVPLLTLLVSLEFLVSQSLLPEYLVPTPSSVIRSMAGEGSEIWTAFWQTTWTSGLGLMSAIVGGVFLGILFSSSEIFRLAFLPYAVFFQTVPIIAIAPLLVIWFGYGPPTVVISAFIVAIFPVIASTLTGMASVEKDLIHLFKLYGASSWATLTKLLLPSALPQIFVGFRIAAGLAVIGAVVGEFIAGGGLGGLVDVARTRQRLDQVFAAVVLAAFVALAWIFLINRFSRFSLRHWHASELVGKSD